MNAFPEMLQCTNTPSNVNSGAEFSVFERQRARMKWQHEHHQQQQSFFNENELNVYPTAATQSSQFQSINDSDFGNLLDFTVKLDPSLDNGWPDYGKLGGDDEYSGYGYGNELNYTISRTTSCVSAVPIEGTLGNDTNGRNSVVSDKMNSCTGRDSFKKRKADKVLDKMVIEVEGNKAKKCKGHVEEGESKITTEQNNNSIKRETSNDTSKDNSKVSDVQKRDYIHVRARRGQATDSHSLAERVRREKISERMKYLQDLVPGCNKITGKAGMLDEIINYVQSLQKQVEFLSMKLATVNPQIDLNIEDFFTKEQMFSACTSEMAAGHAYLQFNTLQQAVTCGMNLAINPSEMTLSTPISNQEALVHSSCFNQIQHLTTWDAELPNLYNGEFQQGNSTLYPSQQFTDCIEGTDLKMEM